ncbi:hypothetical protein HYPSUDRAFT_218932 [Hypholoma sublateritium FD-334 SS-4]|uniref:G-protein coupled receptors family 1 profile domain-containing protein n=1 Tax=Hypholoma sublateritium (strain FD-334 SS-4) TaxID=945553 RepID=A0A0D2M2K9_HYPSF|nr:hypothetical protein HYPSUDRAFT_218932 [Hypholoma sublateritium FD-334 SS-4]
MSSNNASVIQGDTIRVENATIGYVYNAFLINFLLLGIYTTVYFGTLYIYLTSKTSRNLVVLSAITVQYLLNVEQTVIEWIWINILFETIGESKSAAVAYSTVGPSWSYLLTNINAFLLAVIADSLMIWRCYNVWNGSIRAILLPSLLLLAEIGVGIANIVKISVDRFNSIKYFSGHSLWTQTSLALFSTFALTMITTSLIVYRIYNVARYNNLPNRTKTTFKGIVDFIVQSSAVYSVVLLLYAISWTITESSSAAPTIQQIPQNYLLRFTEQVSFIFAGMAPTVMVARIARVSSKDMDREIVTARISDLRFQTATRDAAASEAFVESSVAEESEK